MSVLKNIDYSKLREQKDSLIDIINHVDTDSTLEYNLLGILHLIDSIQDYGVDVLGKSEEEVFNI